MYFYLQRSSLGLRACVFLYLASEACLLRPASGVRLFRALAVQQAQGGEGGPAPVLEYPKLPPSLAPSGSLGAPAPAQAHKSRENGKDGDSPSAEPAATTFSTGRKRRASTRRQS